MSSIFHYSNPFWNSSATNKGHWVILPQNWLPLQLLFKGSEKESHIDHLQSNTVKNRENPSSRSRDKLTARNNLKNVKKRKKFTPAKQNI